MIRRAQFADLAGLAEVHVAAWRETYTGLVPALMIATQSLARRRDAWAQWLQQPQASAFLVELDGSVAGFGACGPQRCGELRERGFTGEIEALYVRRAAQGKGHGRELMRRMAGELAARGLGSASLWVLDANRAARVFYERLGGRVIGARAQERPTGVLQEVAYGWPTLECLNPISGVEIG